METFERLNFCLHEQEDQSSYTIPEHPDCRDYLPVLTIREAIYEMKATASQLIEEF
ncbi:MAG TPA: hypothetical protein VKM55_17625 [Candidatus Lokiarchaeia archaeon]|nr:hypothetical protein [Candidatus Lokiarchaeia archaeon]